MLSVKQGGIRYHFLSLWYDSTSDWTQVSQTIGKHFNHFAKVQWPKVWTPLIPPAMFLNSTTLVLLKGWLWYWITYEGWYGIKQKKQTTSQLLSHNFCPIQIVKYVIKYKYYETERLIHTHQEKHMNIIHWLLFNKICFVVV